MTTDMPHTVSDNGDLDIPVFNDKAVGDLFEQMSSFLNRIEARGP